MRFSRRELHVGLRLFLPIGLGAVALALSTASARLEAIANVPVALEPTPEFQEMMVRRAPLDEVPGVEYEIHRGQTVSQVLQRHGVTSEDTWAAVEALRPYLDLRKVRAGDRYAVLDRGAAAPAAFRFEVAGKGRIVLARRTEGWESTWTPFVRSSRLAVVRGELIGSLDESLQRSGAPTQLAFRMADALQWDLDFNRDLQRGDRFEVLYEEIYLDGEFWSIGDIVALTYDNSGRMHEVYRWGRDGGLYTADGRPLVKMFLRSPLAYSRVTSRFSHHRFHPVLKSYRPHYGVDYGAPVGTPVRVTANGSVTFADWTRGGGKTVKVRHPNGFITAYLHLSRFAPGVRPGAPVRQGQVIAFTGNTGLSSGPHLDYRVQLNGRWIDPLALDNVPAEPIPAAELARFHEWRDACRISLAMGEASPDLHGPGGSGGDEPQLARRSAQDLGIVSAAR